MSSPSRDVQWQVVLPADPEEFGSEPTVYEVSSQLEAEMKIFEMTFGLEDHEAAQLDLTFGVVINGEYYEHTNEMVYLDEELDALSADEAREIFVGSPVFEASGI